MSATSKWMPSLLNFKVILLMYFSGAMFVYLLLDLVLWRTGALETLACWQLFAGALALSATHYLFFEGNRFPALSGVKRMGLHFALNYAVVLTLFVVFGRIHNLGLASIATFTLIFVIIYVGIAFGFSVYYRAQKDRLNAQLLRYKQEKA